MWRVIWGGCISETTSGSYQASAGTRLVWPQVIWHWKGPWYQYWYQVHAYVPDQHWSVILCSSLEIQFGLQVLKEHRDLAFLKPVYWDAMLQDENFLPFLELESPPTLSTNFTKIVKLACLVATTLPCSYGVYPL